MTYLLSVPIELPNRKMYWDWGMQMNFDLPYNIDKFINVPIWPGKFGDRKRRNLIELPHQSRGNYTWSDIADKYNDVASNDSGKHYSDFTAGEFYYALENILTRYVSSEF